MDRIKQEEVSVLQVKKTVDWLVNNTRVSVFDPIHFTGYQRSIDEKHCESIVKYLSDSFYLPTSIICASRDKYEPDKELYIVDGQHRIQAFKILKDRMPDRYQQIRDNELSVIVLEDAAENIEIDTFITINKTSKKVDTSLAYVLKNRINQGRADIDLSISKRDYVAVELARALNGEDRKTSDLWNQKILYEGATRNTPQLISLNAFVKSMRALLASLERYHAIELRWSTKEEIDNCIDRLIVITNGIWNAVRFRWPELFDSDVEKRRTIQGSIGFTSINRFISLKMKQEDLNFIQNAFEITIAEWIRAIELPYRVWLPGEHFSKYSSERGYSIIAQELLDNCYTS